MCMCMCRCVCMCIYIYIYIYIMLNTHTYTPIHKYIITSGVKTVMGPPQVTNFDRLGKKVRPGTFGEDKSRLTGGPQKPLCQQAHTQLQ